MDGESLRRKWQRLECATPKSDFGRHGRTHQRLRHIIPQGSVLSPTKASTRSRKRRTVHVAHHPTLSAHPPPSALLSPLISSLIPLRPDPYSHLPHSAQHPTARTPHSATSFACDSPTKRETRSEATSTPASLTSSHTRKHTLQHVNMSSLAGRGRGKIRPPRRVSQHHHHFQPHLPRAVNTHGIVYTLCTIILRIHIRTHPLRSLLTCRLAKRV
jgi:hypothetical protein